MSNLCTVLTGAGRGLGRAMALGLLKSGHSVVAIDRDQSELTALDRDAVGIGGQLACLPMDITRDDSAKSIIAFAEHRFGPINCLVNCAGIGQEIISAKFATEPVKFWTVGQDIWNLVFAVDADAVFRLCAAVTPGMIARGWGRIVNVTTSLETMIRPGMSPYGPAKAATEALSAIMAKDLLGTGVSVNVLVPGGPAATRMMPQFLDNASDNLISPDVMAAPIVWLLSKDSEGVSGQRFRANAWVADIDPAEAARRAAAPTAWPGLAGGSAQANYHGREPDAH